jgi:hypothetical protein
MMSPFKFFPGLEKLVAKEDKRQYPLCDPIHVRSPRAPARGASLPLPRTKLSRTGAFIFKNLLFIKSLLTVQVPGKEIKQTKEKDVESALVARQTHRAKVTEGFCVLWGEKQRT